MKNWLVITLIFTTLAGCDKKPERISLTEDQQVQLLADLHMAESAVQHLPPAVKDSMIRVYYDQIFMQYHLTQDDYDALMKNLRDNVDKMQPLYEKVLEELSKREAF